MLFRVRSSASLITVLLVFFLLFQSTASASATIHRLGPLAGSNTSYGLSINGSGQVVGYSDTNTFAPQRAFRYVGTPGNGGVLEDLSTLFPGVESNATAINASESTILSLSFIAGITLLRRRLT